MLCTTGLGLYDTIVRASLSSSAFHIMTATMISFCSDTNAFVMMLMQKAKAQGDFLLVGLHTDEDVSERRGPHLPIMDLHERCLSVLACKYVDEVIIGTLLA